MKISANLVATSAGLRRFMWRYSLTIFLVPTIGAVALATFLMYQVVLSASTLSASDTASTISFDKDTMNKIKKLQPATSQDTYSLPTNQRSNPFTE